MALITIPSGDYYITSSDSLEIANFDGMLRVSDRKASTITSRPTESGYDYQDAVHNQARILDISIIIANTSQSIIDVRSYATLATEFTEAQTYIQEQLDIIENYQEKRQKVNFITQFKEYNDYLITNISYDETDDQALVINFSLIETREGTVETTDTNDAGVYS